MCVLGFVFNSVLPLVNRFVIPVYGGLTPVIVTGYVVFVFMGWLIKTRIIPKRRVYLFICRVFRSRSDVFGTYIVSKKSGETDTLFMDYTSIACLPMSAAVFTAAKYIKWERLFRVIPENS